MIRYDNSVRSENFTIKAFRRDKFTEISIHSVIYSIYDKDKISDGYDTVPINKGGLSYLLDIMSLCIEETSHL